MPSPHQRQSVRCQIDIDIRGRGCLNVFKGTRDSSQIYED